MARAFLTVLLICFLINPLFGQPKNFLTGTWKVMADQEINASGKVIREDKKVDGLIIYTANGKMSSQFCWQGRRAPIMTDSVMDKDGQSSGLGTGSNSWSLTQSRVIIDTYDAYFGDYTIDWKQHVVTHIISGNLRPEKTGTVYRRKFELKGDSLLLRSADPRFKWQVLLVRVK